MWSVLRAFAQTHNFHQIHTNSSWACCRLWEGHINLFNKRNNICNTKRVMTWRTYSDGDLRNGAKQVNRLIPMVAMGIIRHQIFSRTKSFSFYIDGSPWEEKKKSTHRQNRHQWIHDGNPAALHLDLGSFVSWEWCSKIKFSKHMSRIV